MTSFMSFILIKLKHRGGVSSDGVTGDGAGLLIDIPHSYFKKVCNFNLPEERNYAVGMLFIPKNQTDFFRDIFSKEIKKQLKTNLPVISEALNF